MSDHVIIQARDSLIALLKAAATAAATRVYRWDEVLVTEIDSGNSPLIIVLLGDETDERMAVNGSASDPAILEDINKTIFVHCVVKMDGDAEKAAVNLRGQAEAAVLGTVAGLTLGGKALMVTRVAAANNRDEALDQGAYNEVLQLEVKIRHLEGQPTSFFT